MKVIITIAVIAVITTITVLRNPELSEAAKYQQIGIRSPALMTVQGSLRSPRGPQLLNAGSHGPQHQPHALSMRRTLPFRATPRRRPAYR